MMQPSIQAELASLSCRPVGSVNSASSLLPVLEIPEPVEDNMGTPPMGTPHMSTPLNTTTGLIAESRRPPMSPRFLQRSVFRESALGSDLLVNAEGAPVEYASTPRRRFTNVTSSAQWEMTADGAVDSTNRRRSINAAKEHLLPYDM